MKLFYFCNRCGREQITVTDPYFGDYEREYLEFLPSSYTPDGQPYPLILGMYCTFNYKLNISFISTAKSITDLDRSKKTIKRPSLLRV